MQLNETTEIPVPTNHLLLNVECNNMQLPPVKTRPERVPVNSSYTEDEPTLYSEVGSKISTHVLRSSNFS